jgi:hypothetical protein
VRAMMQEQHKAMFIALRDGQYDYLFDESASAPNAAHSAQAAADAAKARKPSVAVEPAVSPAPEPEIAPPPPRPAVAPPPRPQTAAPPAIARPAPSPVPPAPPSPPSPPDVSKRVSSRPRLDLDPGAIHGALPVDRETSIDLDLDALERAAAEAQTPFYQQIQDLPPPPAAVLGNKRTSTGGGYSVRSSPPEGGSPGSPGRYSADHTPPRRAPTPPTPPVPLAVPGRYAPSRPASIFATTRPQEGSLFGENLISEKSLDEVILSYLADDLEAPDKK